MESIQNSIPKKFQFWNSIKKDVLTFREAREQLAQCLDYCADSKIPQEVIDSFYKTGLCEGALDVWKTVLATHNEDVLCYRVQDIFVDNLSIAREYLYIKEPQNNIFVSYVSANSYEMEGDFVFVLKLEIATWTIKMFRIFEQY